MGGNVLNSCEKVSSSSTHVSLNKESIKKVAEGISLKLIEDEFSLENWGKHELHPSTPCEDDVDWLFVIDTLNFSFWAEDDAQYAIQYKDRTWTGYWSLVAAINRAIEEGVDMRDPRVYSNLTLEEFNHIFRSSTKHPVPMLETRHEVLTTVGKTLVNRFDGSFKNCIKLANQSAQKLLDLVVDSFPCFCDKSTYNDEEVWILKRVQILVADLWGCFKGASWGQFDDIDSITMFADYRVPQSLVFLGMMEYDDFLLELLKKGTLLKNGSPEEIEIRANSVWCVELLRREVLKILHDHINVIVLVFCAYFWTGYSFMYIILQQGDVTCNSIILDFYLWDMAKDEKETMKDVPIHHTRCIYY
eukprot:m.72013 g.72013  ORF g.72013 m.72013 type:complete len:360 (+) comp8365_c0_seq15:302-1381(+)